MPIITAGMSHQPPDWTNWLKPISMRLGNGNTLLLADVGEHRREHR